MTRAADFTAEVPHAVLAAQATFRAVMETMARPGTIQAVAGPGDAPAPLAPGTAALALALFDGDTPIWLDAAFSAFPAVATWLRFNTGAPITPERATSAFALIADGSALADLDGFALGSDDYPDRSTTLVVQVPSLTDGSPITLSGPGIAGTTILSAVVQPSDILDRLADTRGLFPRGLDLIFVADDSMAAIPRTTRFATEEA